MKGMISTLLPRRIGLPHSTLLQLVLLLSISVTLSLSQLDSDTLDSSGNYADENYVYDYYNDNADKPNALVGQHSENDKSTLVTPAAIKKIEDYYDYNDDQYVDNYDDSNYDYDQSQGHEFIDPNPADVKHSMPDPVNSNNIETSTQRKTTQKTARSKLLAIMAKPGILAGIVGGAIIGVLTAILLIMFIVYRMRKKDEGSYALEETKKPLNAYDYRHCPTKEFYA